MNLFFKPSPFKIKLFFALVIYIFISMIFLASYNSTRSKGSRELHTFEKVGIAIASPSVFLTIPVFYVGANIFTTEGSLNELWTDNGCRNCTQEEFNTPVKKSSAFGLISGLIVEIFFLYFIACFISFIKQYYRKEKGTATI